jgi:hypothetical protein
MLIACRRTSRVYKEYLKKNDGRGGATKNWSIRSKEKARIVVCVEKNKQHVLIASS